MGVWLTREVAPPHMSSYLAKFGCSRSHGTSERTEIPRKKMGPSRPILRSLEDVGTDTCPLTTCDFLSVIRSSHGPMSCLIQSYCVLECLSTIVFMFAAYFLIICIMLWLFLLRIKMYILRFPDKRRFQSKIEIFPPLAYLMAPLRGSSRNFVTSMGSKTTP